MGYHRGDDSIIIGLDDTGAGAKEQLLIGLAAAAAAAAKDEEPGQYNGKQRQRSRLRRD
jgi:hypothetical protein